MRPKKDGKIIVWIVALAAIGTAGILGVSFYFSTSSIHELLTENRDLNRAIHNLTKEEQIGYATVQEQRKTEGGQTETVVRFVQTEAGEPRRIVSEQLFAVLGKTIHFDALIVKFTDEFVRDGEERALYLWRRIHGEDTPPGQAKRIERPGSEPERYYAITKTLRMQNRKVFWESIWDLANDPEALSEHGVKAVFGNTVYMEMEPDKLYKFKISPTGQIYPEVADAR
ncbi:MAG: hypothetical protein ACLFUF_08185 [Opitutales bacterium]